jgi:hypothetical protein
MANSSEIPFAVRHSLSPEEIEKAKDFVLVEDGRHTAIHTTTGAGLLSPHCQTYLHKRIVNGTEVWAGVCDAHGILFYTSPKSVNGCVADVPIVL